MGVVLNIIQIIYTMEFDLICYPNTMHNGFSFKFHRNSMHYVIWRNFQPNTIPYGFLPNFHHDTVHYVFSTLWT